MQRTFFGIGIVLMLLGIFGMSYTWNYDHREASTLEEYATIDFKASRDGDGNLEGAVFTLWDYRYDKAQLLQKAILFTDNIPWDLNASTRQTSDFLRNENKLFISFPKICLKDMLLAEEIRIKFYYDNGQSIDLPLGKKELIEWQRRLRW